MAQKLPSSLCILGVKFNVAWNHDFDDEKEETFGDTHVLGKKIRIGTRCHTSSDRASTFFHEALHAALGVAGYSEMLGTKQEEALVTCIENALYPHLEMICSVAKQK